MSYHPATYLVAERRLTFFRRVAQPIVHQLQAIVSDIVPRLRRVHLVRSTRPLVQRHARLEASLRSTIHLLPIRLPRARRSARRPRHRRVLPAPSRRARSAFRATAAARSLHVVPPFEHEIGRDLGDFGIAMRLELVHCDADLGAAEEVFGGCDAFAQLVEHFDHHVAGLGRGGGFCQVRAQAGDFLRGERHGGWGVVILVNAGAGWVVAMTKWCGGVVCNQW